MPTKLAECGVKLSPLGLGIEHFAKGVWKVKHLSRDEHTRLILQTAFELGITHFDLVFNLPYFFDEFGAFLKGKREKITFTAHLGNCYNEKTKSNKATRSLKPIQETFDSMIKRLDVDSVDIALLQYIKHEKDYSDLIRKGNLSYVKQLKDDGLTKAIGVSAHNPKLLARLIEENEGFDVAMFTLNFATGFLDGTKELIETCRKKGVSFIAIKSMLKGKVFSSRKATYPAYMCSGNRFILKLETPASPYQCYNYALDLGAEAVVFGVKQVEELEENVQSFTANRGKKDYHPLVSQFQKALLET
ncbi:MAG: aldo/keto reductase [Candidatus Hodarchaeales archaeon]|jgi:aryl-alcohol dehydrogenase-like predicted oxidoreductase